METSILMRVLASSVNLAARASTIVRNVLASKDLEIVDKGVNDLQSKADRDAQRCIVGSLTQTFPGLKVIGKFGRLCAIMLDLFSFRGRGHIGQQWTGDYCRFGCRSHETSMS